MGRRKKSGNPINGWVIVDKPIGMTSNSALGKVKWLLKPQKAGHAGTLDPLASGCLPIALGEATKTVSFAMDGLKIYRFTVRWGVETDSADSEGETLRTSDERPTQAAIEAILARFVGDIMQKPPAFSAIRINGERAYDLARAGEKVDLDPRPVFIDRLELIDMPDEQSAVFETECGKGTYVRALARDMGEILGCFGHVTALRRLTVGSFNEEDFISLEILEELRNKSAEVGEMPMDFLLPVETALDDIPALAIGRNEETRIRQGRSVLVRGQEIFPSDETVCAMAKDRLIALGTVDKGIFQPSRVFNL